MNTVSYPGMCEYGQMVFLPLRPLGGQCPPFLKFIGTLVVGAMAKKHRENRQRYVDHLRKLEKDRDEKQKEKDEKKRARGPALVGEAPKAISAQSATGEASRNIAGETSVKKVRTEK